MSQALIRIIQLSDLHLFADKTKALLGVNTEESFQAVFHLLQQESGNIDMVLLTGDLSQDGSVSSYKRIASTLQNLAVPVYYVPGNHDNVEMMRKVYPDKTILEHKHIILNGWQIILLNSQIPGAVEGYLDQEQFSFLEHCLKTHPELQTVIAFHHHPFFVGSLWLDRLGLKNANKFWEVIAPYPQVNTVLFGHVHQEVSSIMNGVKCYSAPSTCFQFMRHQDEFGLEKLPPGYRRIHLYPQGQVLTHVLRVSEYVGEFDVQAKGY